MNTSESLNETGTHDAKRAFSLKEKAAEELKRYWAIFIYLAVVFGSFTIYRRLIMSESGVDYLHYGFAVVKALILAKIILIGEALRLGRRFEHPPLIIAALYKSLVFGLFFALFAVLEHTIEGLVHHEGWTQIAQSFFAAGWNEILARTIMVIVAFVPFFAFLETDRVLGEGKLFGLFFRHA
jgi:hypothetical protein